MSDYDVFTHFKSENERRFYEALRGEDNPIHRQHIEEFAAMMDEKIRTQVPQMLQQYNDTQRVNVEAYFNGKPATDANIVKGVRDMVTKALKHAWKK